MAYNGPCRRNLNGLTRGVFEDSAPDGMKDFAGNIYDALVYVAGKAECQPVSCEKRFVKLIHAKIAAGVTVGLCVGYGILNWKTVLTALPFFK